MNELENFKRVLEYFVAHLEYCVTSNNLNRGYDEYIRSLSSFTRSGQGHKGQNIQHQIKGWDTYDSGTICINVNPTVYQGRGSYLNWKNTAINVNALWDNNSIVNLRIVKDSYPISNAKDVLTNTVIELGLFDGQEPNDALGAFFHTYNALKLEWNKNEQQNRDMEKIQPYADLLKQVKNLILTGAPGTGKTFLAKQIAKQLIGVQTDEELEKSGQYTFVQFHPSYDYTDFVEGLRPMKPDANGNIGFKLKDGVFKRFCKKAMGVSAIAVGRISNFTLDDYESYLQNLGLSDSTIRTYRLRLEQLLGNKVIARNREAIDWETYPSLEEICENSENINAFDINNGFYHQFSAAVTNLISFRDNLSTSRHIRSEAKPVFVFVIDEINRGEISKIFGELFFSIDPSYRGKKGAVKTQYSNLHEDEDEVFYVPDNVYIIGSMNDIDRSVESFDFAMRRRFTWKEITAMQSAGNMGLPEETAARMANLNEQISGIEGLNSSYHIGGAYFLDTFGSPSIDYDSIWGLRIEPLLKEYLRGLPDGEERLKTLKNAYNA